MPKKVRSNLSDDQLAFCERLREFCGRHRISSSMLVRMCESAGRFSQTSANLLLHGRVAAPLFERVRPLLPQELRSLLAGRGFTETEIDEELSTLFEAKEYEKMSENRCQLLPEVYRFFGLTEDPFDIDRLPAPDEIYTNGVIDDVLYRVADAVKFHRFLAVVGPVGSGKTILKLRLADQVASGGKTILIYPEFFEFGEISVANVATEILAALDQPVPRDKTRRVPAIKNVLADLQQDGVDVALVFDEAHRLNGRVITALKNFWELTNGRSSRLLAIVLFGWPYLVDTTLRNSQFREIRQRVQVIRMPEMADSGQSYIEHKLRLVGGDISQIFAPKALKKICDAAKTPLALGNIVNAALTEAFEKEERQITPDLEIFKTLNTTGVEVRKY